MAETIYEPVPDSRLLGVMRAINGIRDAVAIIHGKSCCHADTLLFNILTGSHDDIRLVGSGIRSQDISVGGYRKLSLAIQSAYREFRPALIAVLVASFPTLMGDDVEGTLESMKEDIPCELWSFSCAGHEGHASRGLEEVMTRLVQYMTASAPVKNLINLIGFKSDDPHGEADLKEIKRMLVDQGIELNAVLTASSLDEIKKAPSASLNAVLSGEGLECARLMKQGFGTPYARVPYPFGWQQSLEFLDKIANRLGIELNREVVSREKARIKNTLQKVYTYLQGIYGLSAAVVGDGSRALNLARFLGNELGLDVRALCVTGRWNQRQNTAGPGFNKRDLEAEFGQVVSSSDEFHTGQSIRSKGVDVIFGSTMEKEICKDLGIPLVRIFYPVLDAVSVADIPYAGFRGTINLTQTVINAIIGQG